jgi:hypothetical protein
MVDPQAQAAIKRAADRYNVDAVLLGRAINDESAAQLAAVLGLSQPEAHARIEQIQRVLAVNNDWGAGCKLLTDEITAQLVAAIDAF